MFAFLGRRKKNKNREDSWYVQTVVRRRCTGQPHDYTENRMQLPFCVEYIECVYVVNVQYIIGFEVAQSTLDIWWTVASTPLTYTEALRVWMENGTECVHRNYNFGIRIQIFERKLADRLSTAAYLTSSPKIYRKLVTIIAIKMPEIQYGTACTTAIASGMAA